MAFEQKAGNTHRGRAHCDTVDKNVMSLDGRSMELKDSSDRGCSWHEGRGGAPCFCLGVVESSA